MFPGGQRQRSGRRSRDTVTVSCSIPGPVYAELVRSEQESGIYRTRIAAQILTEQLVSDIVERELSVSATCSPALGAGLRDGGCL